LWEEWAGITRFLESTRLAFARETSLWKGLDLDAPPEDIQISVSTGKGRFRVALDQHLATMNDQTILHASVLIHSYALAESVGAIRLRVDARELHGIEDWGSQLLHLNSKAWSQVRGGKAGAVEVAVIRNAFAHGTRRIDGLGARRLAKCGAPVRHPGSPVSLAYEDLREYRDRLRSFLSNAAPAPPPTTE
jgi:hypothetical protein